MLNKKSVLELIERYANDPEGLDFIKSCIDSFEKYHQAVFDDQTFLLLYSGGRLDGSEYRDRRAALDKARTAHHNSVLASVNLLNRMAAAAGLPPLYDGVVSEERPYRRQVANAVFAFIEDVINSRT